MTQHISDRTPLKRERPDKKDYYMALAIVASAKSTCDGRHVGAVITDEKMDSVLSTGYNGNARGLSNKCEVDKLGDCGCLHAEQNAIAHCFFREQNKVLFTQVFPCLPCSKWIIQFGFKRIIYLEEFVDVNKPINEMIHRGVRTRHNKKVKERNKTIKYFNSRDIALEKIEEKPFHKKLRKLVHQINSSRYSEKIFEKKHTNNSPHHRKAA